MEKHFAFKITCALYRVSDRLPQNEPLRKCLRQVGLAILEDVFKEKSPNNNIIALRAYLDLAKDQGWLAKENFIVLANSYQLLLKKQKEVLPASQINQEKSPSGLKSRHKKIIDILQKQGEAQIKDINQVLPGLNRRTILRDVNFLLSKGFLKKKGNKNDTRYFL